MSSSVNTNMMGEVADSGNLVKNGGSTVDTSHPIFVRDPAEWMCYVHKEVCVVAVDGRSHTGWVYTIDPVSQSIVLVTFPADIDSEEPSQMQNLKIIMGHAIREMTVLDEDSERHKQTLDDLFKWKMDKPLSDEELTERRNKLKCWFQKNHIPVEVCGDAGDVLSVCAGAVLVVPPYGEDYCRSTNEIILGRIQGLMKNMPSDVADW